MFPSLSPDSLAGKSRRARGRRSCGHLRRFEAGSARPGRGGGQDHRIPKWCGHGHVRRSRPARLPFANEAWTRWREPDRKGVVSGKEVSVRVGSGLRLVLQKKNKEKRKQ